MELKVSFMNYHLISLNNNKNSVGKTYSTIVWNLLCDHTQVLWTFIDTSS